MHRDELIEQITRLAKADSRVLGLFLTGSLGAGTGDPWSDVDTVFVVTPSDHGAFVAELRDWVSQVAVPLIWRQVYPPHPLFHTVLPNWLRLDMTITTLEHLIGTQAGARALHDPQGLFQRLPAALDPRGPDPARVAYLIEEFLRVIALLPLSVGREEPVVGVSGVGLLRGLLIDLMVEAQAPPVTPGALSLARVLPPGDIDILAGLPAVAATSPSVIAASLAVAQAFLPRSRTLADASGAPWPAELVEEVSAHLKHALDIDLPD